MRNTRENVVKLLEARIKNLRDIASSAKTDNPEWAKNLRYEATGLEAALEYLTDNKYFNDVYEIFCE